MSQKKVDAYKKEKANRDKIIKKEKRILLIEKIVGLAVCLAAVCWIGYSVYAKVTANQEAVIKDTVMDTSALDDYVSGLTADEDAEETDVEDVTEADVEDVTEAEEADAEDAAEVEEAGVEDTAEADTVDAAEDTDNTTTAADAEETDAE